MKKIMRKKVNVFGKTVPVFVLVLLGIGLVSAALITSWGTITGLVTVDQGLFLDNQAWDAGPITYAASLTSLDAKQITSGHYLDNSADVDATVYLKTTCLVGAEDCSGDVPVSTDTVGLSTKWSTEAGAFADASMAGGVVTLVADKFSTEDWSSSEARIVILGEDVGVTTLNDLVNMSWDVDVKDGYIAHVDVIIDTNGNGEADDALIFEAAKVDPVNCQVIPYPDGEQDTLGVVSIIDDTSYAWLSSGAAGPGCINGATPDSGVTIFYTNTLSGWKTGHESIIGTNTVLRFEIEVDPWIADSKSEISNIVINGKTITIGALGNPVIVEGNSGLAFYVNSDFPKMLVPGTYNITTIVDDTV